MKIVSFVLLSHYYMYTKNKYVNKKKSVEKVDQVVGNINSTYLIEQELLYGESDYFVQF